MPALSIVPDVLCLAACAVAVVTDVRSFRIPNWLTGSTFLLGLLANTLVAGVAGGGSAWWGDGLLPSLIGSAVLLAVFLAAAAPGLMGMGDAKLAAAAGACLRWPHALAALVYIFLAGGALSIVLSLRPGHRRRVRDAGSKLPRSRVPYGVAIAAGCAFAVLARWVPDLRLLL